MSDFEAAKTATLVFLAFIVAFSAFLIAFPLAARARDASPEGRAGWIFLASAAFGSGLWGGHALLYVADGSGFVFRSGLLFAGYFVAVAAGYTGLTLIGGLGRSVGALFAGAVTAVALATMDSIGLFSLSTLDVLQWRAPSAAAAGAVAAVLAGLGHAVGGQAKGEIDGPSAFGAGLMALAVLGSNSLLLGSSSFVAEPQFVATPDGVASQGIAAAVALLMFLVVGSGMATALIDRDGHYASQRRLRQMAEASVEGLVILADNRVVDVNDSFLRISGLTRSELIGTPFVGPLLVVDIAGEAIPQSMLWEGHLSVGGRMVPVEVVAHPVEYDGRPHTAFAIRDLSDRRDAELRIRYLAEHDVLTGLPNRASFQRELEARCVGVGADRFALICLDLDRFKEANDVFGHLAGDAVLVQVASRLRELAGPETFVARLGGDEFVLIVPQVANVRVLADLADAIVAGLARPFLYGGHRIVIGASVGIAVGPGDGDAPDLLFARADMALYRAKSQGRGGYCFFEQSMDEETRLRRQLAFELRDAIASNQLELHYQPLADVASSGIVGFEALVRWEHPVHGTIAPSIFVSIAEESGSITELGEWVLRTACTEAGRWKQPLRIAVNLSALQLDEPTLPETVHQVLVTSGLSPVRLELEVTESSLMRNPQRALDVLRRIKALGVKIAMDDFGTGFSSLSTLQSFPFDKLKIDRSFVDRVGMHGQAESIVRAVVGLSRSLSIKVVAEGVENQSQMSFLTDEACDEVQGFMIGKPMPIEAYRDVVGYEGRTEATPQARARARMRVISRARSA